MTDRGRWVFGGTESIGTGVFTPTDPGTPGGGTGVQAAMADKLVDMYGVIGHLERNAYTPLSTIVTRCVDLGLRHMRCRLFDGANGKQVLDGAKAIYDAGVTANGIGMKLWGPVGGYDKALDTAGATGSLETILDYAANYTGASTFLEGLEGLNENNLQQGGSAWDSADASHMKRVKTKRDAIAATKAWFGSLTLVAPSIGTPGASLYTTLQTALVAGSAQGSIDVGNGHLYTSGYTVGDHLVTEVVNQAKGVAGQISGHDKVVWMTEGGSHNALGSTKAGDFPISEKADGYAEPHRLLEYFERSIFVLKDDGTPKTPYGIARCTKYELVDEGTSTSDKQMNYGLLRNDLSPKPNFVSLKNLFGLLKDPGADFTPGKLPYRVLSGPADLRTRLFQKRNGDFYLVLWRHVEVWDRNLADRTKADVTPTAATFQVALDVLTETTHYVPTKQAGATVAANRLAKQDVTLGGDVLVMHVKVLPV